MVIVESAGIATTNLYGGCLPDVIKYYYSFSYGLHSLNHGRLIIAENYKARIRVIANHLDSFPR